MHTSHPHGSFSLPLRWLCEWMCCELHMKVSYIFSRWACFPFTSHFSAYPARDSFVDHYPYSLVSTITFLLSPRVIIFTWQLSDILLVPSSWLLLKKWAQPCWLGSLHFYGHRSQMSPLYCQVLPPYSFNKSIVALFKFTLSCFSTFLQHLHSHAHLFQQLQLKKLPLWTALIHCLLLSPYSKGSIILFIF